MIELGSKVKDIVSGLKGVAVSRIEYLNGCVQYGVKPPVGKDGKDVDCQYIDEGQLEVTKAKKVTPIPKPAPLRRTGGPSRFAPGR